MDVRTKRVYEDAAPDDGYRVLVDHIWPRGVSKRKAAIDEWAKDLAPGGDLRKWFDHDPDRFEEFARRFRAELEGRRERLGELRRRAREGRLTLVFAARDSEHSNAAVLAGVIRHGLR